MDRSVQKLANNFKPLTAIVLAGGRSSRMGQDKALLSIQGVPLLQLVCNIAQSCADTVYVVTPWPERYQEVLPTTCRFIREVPLPGENTSEISASSKVMPLPHGPLVGFAQGLAQAQTAWVLLLACDLPRLRVEVSTAIDVYLLSQILSTKEVARFNNGWRNILCNSCLYQKMTRCCLIATHRLI